jgi:hypothetical protein
MEVRQAASAERRSGLAKVLEAMPCTGEGCSRADTCQSVLAAQLADRSKVRMSHCPTTRDGEPLRYRPIPRIRSLDAETTDWGDLYV